MTSGLSVHKQNKYSIQNYMQMLDPYHTHSWPGLSGDVLASQHFHGIPCFGVSASQHFHGIPLFRYLSLPAFSWDTMIRFFSFPALSCRGTPEMQIVCRSPLPPPPGGAPREDLQSTLAVKLVSSQGSSRFLGRAFKVH